MKSRISSFILNFFIALMAVSFTACNQSGASAEATADNKDAKSSLQIADLLPRSGKVGNPNEANKMSNTYTELRKQIEKDPKNYGARLKMADLYIVEARATGNYNYYYPAAVEMIDAVLAENPENPDDQFRALTSKAVILLSLHKFEEAEEMGEKALAINPHNSRVYGILTDANVELGNYDKAVVMADSMVGIRPDLRSYSRVSYLREIYGDVDGAKEAMEMAVKAGYPGHEETSWSRVTLGNLHESYGELDKAEMQYQMALNERPGYAFALSGLASVEAKKGNYDKSVELLKEAIDVREEAAFYEQLALVYHQMDQKPEMEKARKTAFAMLRGMTDESGHGHSHDGDHSHSHGEHGHSHEVGLEMANLYLALTDDYEKALDNALEEYKRRPDNIEVNQALAEVYYKMGNMEKAAEHLQKAMITQTKDPELMLLAGLIEMGKGNETAGRQKVKKSLDMNPYQSSKLATEGKTQLKGKTMAAR